MAEGSSLGTGFIIKAAEHIALSLFAFYPPRSIRLGVLVD